MEAFSNLIGTLAKFIFVVILRVFDIIFMPFVSVITALFPDISEVAPQILSFVNTTLVPYIKFAISVLYNLTGLPPFIISLLMTYFLAKVAGRAIMIVVNFSLNVYQKLKP